MAKDTVLHATARIYFAVHYPLNKKNFLLQVTFHKFPANKALRRRWIHAIRRDPGKNFTLGRTTKVCSKHFTSQDFVPNVASGRQYLQDTAVPSVFPFSKTVSQPRPTRHLEERMLQGNSDLEHNNLALSRDGDTENHEFSNA